MKSIERRFRPATSRLGRQFEDGTTAMLGIACQVAALIRGSVHIACSVEDNSGRWKVAAGGSKCEEHLFIPPVFPRDRRQLENITEGVPSDGRSAVQISLLVKGHTRVRFTAIGPAGKLVQELLVPHPCLAIVMQPENGPLVRTEAVTIRPASGDAVQIPHLIEDKVPDRISAVKKILKVVKVLHRLANRNISQDWQQQGETQKRYAKMEFHRMS